MEILKKLKHTCLLCLVTASLVNPLSSEAPKCIDGIYYSEGFVRVWKEGNQLYIDILNSELTIVNCNKYKDDKFEDREAYR